MSTLAIISISLAILFFVFACGGGSSSDSSQVVNDSDIDIMIISDSLGYPDIMPVIHQVESKLGRTVNPTLYRPSEFRKRIDTDSGFVKRVMDQPKIFLIGTENDIHQP